jgi:RNA polymerase sigma-70 factor (ECF subfamily)
VIDGFSAILSKETGHSMNMNSDELTKEFETFSGELRSFLLRMTASVQDAEDVVQETYLKAASKIETFRGESSLKTWVFSIASNLARDLLRSKRRWPENVTDICREAALKNPVFFNEAMQIRATSPQGNFEIKEHIAFCFTCVSKSLPLEQHLAVLLKEIYGFKVREIAQIIDQSEAMVKYLLHTGRSRMIEVFDGRCSLINKQGICHQCTELNGIFNPKQKEQEELVKIEMVRAAADQGKEQLFDLRMQVLQDLDPFESGAADLQLHHLEHNRQVIEKYLDEKP